MHSTRSRQLRLLLLPLALESFGVAAAVAAGTAGAARAERRRRTYAPHTTTAKTVARSPAKRRRTVNLRFQSGDNEDGDAEERRGDGGPVRRRREQVGVIPGPQYRCRPKELKNLEVKEDECGNLNQCENQFDKETCGLEGVCVYAHACLSKLLLQPERASANSPIDDEGEVKEEGDRHVEAARWQQGGQEGTNREVDQMTKEQREAERLVRKKERLRLKRIAQRKRKRRQERRWKRQQAKKLAQEVEADKQKQAGTSSMATVAPLETCPSEKPVPDTPCTNDGPDGRLSCAYNEQCCPECCFCHHTTFCYCVGGTFNSCAQKIFTPCSLLCRSRTCNDAGSGNRTQDAEEHWQLPRSSVEFVEERR